METEASDTATVDDSTQPPQSPKLLEQWRQLDLPTQKSIEHAAEQFQRGQYDTTSGNHVPHVVHEGEILRPMTLAEMLDQKLTRSRANIDPALALELAQRIVDSLELEIRKRVLAAFLEKLGPRHANSRIQTFNATTVDQREIVRLLTAYCDDVKAHVALGRGIIANGRVGTGKTHLLIGAARRAIGAGLSISYVNGQKLLSDFRSRIGDKYAPSEKDMIDELVKPDILILDDPIPPHGELTSYQEQLLYIATERRYNEQRSTWVAMNVASTEEAMQRVGAAIVDRWKDGALTLAFNWPSHRKIGEFGK